MIRKRNNLVLESKEWKPCTFERDCDGNIIWRFPDDVRGSQFDCLIIEEIRENVSYSFRIYNLFLNEEYTIIEKYNSQFNKTISLKGAYCLEKPNDGINIINKLHNNK